MHHQEALLLKLPASLARHIGYFLWGVAADIAIFLITVMCGLLSISPAFVLRTAKPVEYFQRIWSRWILRVCGIRLEVKGLEQLTPGQSFILAANHQSNCDIWALMAALSHPLKFVTKRELLKVPILGQALMLGGHIIIDRSDRPQAIEAINRAVTRFSHGVGIVFFPEGTRSPDGRIQAFKKGAATLAIQTGLPIVPISISGSRKFFPKRAVPSRDGLGVRIKKAWIARPRGRIGIVIDRPIDTRVLTMQNRDALTEKVRDIVVRNFREEYV